MNVGWRVLLYAATGRRTKSVRTCTLDFVAIGCMLRNREKKNRGGTRVSSLYTSETSEVEQNRSRQVLRTYVYERPSALVPERS